AKGEGSRRRTTCSRAYPAETGKHATTLSQVEHAHKGEQPISAFHDPGKLVDDDLLLVLTETEAGDPTKAFARTYDFAIGVACHTQPAGRMSLRIWPSEYLIRYVGHVAYSVAPEFRGHRYAARACKLLLPLAGRHGLRSLCLGCRPRNLS